jgi:hypothetical protein
MGRSLIWIQGDSDPGWACSSCRWKFPVPTLLASDDAKKAYDRLAAAKFRDHRCEDGKESPIRARAQSSEPTFADRASKLIKAGYKPKDAVDIVTQEILLESRGDAKMREQVRIDGEEFLLRVRKGLI